MEIIPLYDKVLLGEEKQTTTTPSGLIVEGSQGDSKVFVVIAKGPDTKLIKVGDKVFFDLGKAAAVMVGGKQRVLVSEEFLMAVVV